MDPIALRDRFADVVVTTITPFDAEGRVDLDAVERQAVFLVEHGIQVLVPGGNTGEFSSMDPAEVHTVVRRTVEAVGDRCTVVAGVGWSSPVASDLAERAAEAGAHAVMVHHPTHTYIHPDGIAAYYERIVEAVDIGVVLYKRGAELDDQVIVELSAHERVVGVKYAVNDCNSFANLVSAVGDRATCLCGTAERWAPFFALAGARGFTSGLANVRPGLPLAMHEHLVRGDLQGAMRLRSDALAFEELRQRHHSGNNVPVVKEAMQLLGRDTGVLRDPLVPLSQEDRDELRAILRGWGTEVSG